MGEPLFTALATSTRQLHNLLRCIAFTPTATVHITPEGLRFTTDEVHTIQASTILDKNLFSSYLLVTIDDLNPVPPFRLNVNALLETLQIFGIADSSAAYKNQNGGIASSYAAAFTTPALGLGGTCQITYPQIGAPLLVILEENGVKTTCEMNTYTLPSDQEDDDEIPLDRNALAMKIIMPSVWLHDAISELASTNPEDLVVSASAVSEPFFALEALGGPFGDSTVDFAPESRSEAASDTISRRRQPQVTETFAVTAMSHPHGRVKQRYRFDLIKRASKAMNMATKVSIRQDRQGVLSLQFMIESIGSSDADGLGNQASIMSSRFSFVDFRFVPLVDSDEEYDDENNGFGGSDTTEE